MYHVPADLWENWQQHWRKWTHRNFDGLHLGDLCAVKGEKVRQHYKSMMTSTPSSQCFLDRLQISGDWSLQPKPDKSLELIYAFITTLTVPVSWVNNFDSLSLVGNRLIHIDPSVFRGNLSNTLHILNLSNNRIRRLPPTLCYLHRLKRLTLSHNLPVELPASTGKLRNLDKWMRTFWLSSPLLCIISNWQLWALRTDNSFIRPLWLTELQKRDGHPH